MLIHSTAAICASLLACCVDGSINSPRKHPIAPRQASFAPHINGTNASVSDVALQISTKTGGRNATAPLLYGWMFEDISVSSISSLNVSSILN